MLAGDAGAAKCDAFVCAAVLYGLFGYTLGVQLNRGLISGVLEDYVDF